MESAQVPESGEILQVLVDQGPSGPAYRPFLVLYADNPASATGYLFYNPALDRHLEYLKRWITDFIEGQNTAFMTLQRGEGVGQWRRIPHWQLSVVTTAPEKEEAPQ